MLKNFFKGQIAPFAALAMLVPIFAVPQFAQADEFQVEPGPPTLTPITLSENDGDLFTAIQPAWSSSTDRYNVLTSVGFPGGHDDLQKLTMCWYLEDFDDCSDATKIANNPEIVFKATHEVIRVGGVSSGVITGETFRVVGENNYDVSEASTNATEAAQGSVNVDVEFSFRASNAMRASSNWKVYLEVEDRRQNTAATSRDGVRVNYFAAMTLDRQDVNFGGIAKGEASIENNIDSGEYTANGQSQFFIEATNFSDGNGSTLEIMGKGRNLRPNQVQLSCYRAPTFDPYDTSALVLVTTEATQFGSSLPPSSEDPIDASNHSCAASFARGGAQNPNITYSNTFTLSVAASAVTAPQNLSVSEPVDAEDKKTKKIISFDPPQIVLDGDASIDSYRIRSVDVSSDTSRFLTSVTIRQLQEGAWGYTESTSRLTVTVDDLSPFTTYSFEVEASTSLGSGSATTDGSTTAADLQLSPVTLNVTGWANNAITPTNVTPSNFSGDITWAVTEGSLPAGLTLDSSTGVVSGSPNSSGSGSYQITFTDENGNQASQRHNYDIQPEPTVSPGSFRVSLVQAQELQETSLATLDGFGANRTWAVTSGVLPAGLSLNTATGQISGTPTDAGVSSMTITVTDNDNNLTGSQTVFFRITQRTDLYTFESAVFTPDGNTGHLGPSLSQIRSGVTGGGDWINDKNYLDSSNGIITWTVPETGTYRILTAGAGSTVTGGANGQGALMEAWFDLEKGEKLLMLVGQTNKAISRAWSGGGGGTFVAQGSSISNSNPLIVAGGAGASRSKTAFDSRLRGNTGTWGKDGSGGRSGGVNGGAANTTITGVGHNAGGYGSAAGFYASGRASQDNRSSSGHVGPKSFRAGGVGGKFTTGYSGGFDLHGGFGGGGNGGWGGAGGGGGYSGGGDDPNSGWAGGGGSFIAGEGRNARTSDGGFSTTGGTKTTAYSGSVGYIGQWNNGNGYIEIELLD